MLHHSGNKLVVHDVAQHGAVALHQVLEHLQMRFRLREAAAVLNGHGLPDDEFREFRVRTVDALVIDIEGIALATLHELNLRVLPSHHVLACSSTLEHLFKSSHLLGVA